MCACPRLGLAAMGPLTAAESRRAAERSDLPLPADRVIREQTRNSRKVLVARFPDLVMEGTFSFFEQHAAAEAG